VAGRAAIVGAAETSVGKVRDHNEDAHFIDPEAGIFIVCDGMGGHAAGEVASNLAVKTIRKEWSGDGTQKVADGWLELGTPDARKQLLTTVQAGVLAAHDAIVAEASADRGKQGMGTTVVAAIIVGGDVVFAHCGDSRAYLVRDGITVQLTEDHTLLARLLAAGVDVDTDGDGARFKSMLTNALGIGQECKVSTFVVPVADGDRFLLCSDGITEYVQENEIGEVLTTMPSPARSAQRLVELALARGGGDNATALVVRVLEAGETARPAEQMRKDETAIFSCPLWGKVNVQQRLRALRIALPREHLKGEKIPAQTLGDKVAWIVIDGELEQDGVIQGPGTLLYPEALLGDRPLPDKHGLAIAQTDMRALALRADDFRELCDDDPELAEHLLEALATELSRRRPHRRTGKIVVQGEPAADPAKEELARADTGQFAALDPATGNPVAPARVTSTGPAVAPSTSARQPRASTVPPHTVRPRSNTDKGTTAPERAPAPPTPDETPRASSPRLSRGSNPPADTPRSSLISTPADTAAAVDAALFDLESGPVGLPKAAPAAKVVDDNPADDEAEITVEAGEVRSTQNLPPLAKKPAPAPVAAKGTHLSEPEIQISELVEMVADEPEPEPAEDVIELVAADMEDADEPRSKRQSDAPE
jgi:serine/threonine protein phosphatase PrpC